MIQIKDRFCYSCLHWSEVDHNEKFLWSVRMGKCFIDQENFIFRVGSSVCDRWESKRSEVI